MVKYLSVLNQKIRKGCTAHITKSGRLYYMNHETKTSSWLPPVESWDSGGNGLPYGWEAAFDRDGKTYFINHVNKTTTSEDPRKDSDEEPPQPREVELLRDPHKGFGFVAGSEKPVIVRFVTEGGPSEGQLLPGDQILQINGDDVQKSPRERVIELVRSCKHSVKLQVCQPITNNTTRKSALLTAAKKAKLKSNPSRVRFAEGVVINGSPLYCPSPYESYVPFMPNVLKVFLENGQTKSFKYDSTTTVQDVLNVLQEKLSVVSLDHFALVVEHIKAVKRNKFAILNPKDTLAKIAARPGAHNLRCLFRLTFVPKDIYEFMQRDAVGFDYLFMQCCNDVVRERFAPELKYDVTLRLAALHLHQHALNTGIQGKMVVKTIEREYGLEKFVPASLLDTMKRKELVKLLSQLMKQNQALSGPGQKQLTSLQAKFHYLKIVSELPSYGAKLFATSNKNSMAETALIVGPKVGVSQISTIRNIAPINLAQFSEVENIEVTKEDDFSLRIRVALKHPEKESLTLSMEDRDAEEFVFVLERYYSQLVGGEIPVQWEGRDPDPVETVPTFHSRHTVQESPWSYCPSSSLKKDSGTTTILRTVDLSIPPPPYIPCEERQLSRSNSRDQFSLATSPASVDHNMNEMQALVASIASLPIGVPSSSSMPNLKSHSSLDARSNNISSNSTASIPEDETTCIFHIGLNNDETSSNSADFENEQSNPYTALSRNNRPGSVMKALQNLADQTDTIAVQLQKQSEPSGIDMHSVMSIELLEGVEGDVTRDLDMKSQDVISRVNEMSKIVNDAECYLNTDSSTYSVDLGSRCHDSLLFLPCNNQERNASTGEIFDQLLTPDSDLLPSESEGESTPTNSPRHCPDSESPNSTARKCSSFGLHSVNLFGSLDQETEDVEELLRQLQTSTNLPIKEGSLCLDPDIIDLTIVPPPSTDDVNFSHVGEEEEADLTSQLSELTPQNSPVRSCATIEETFCEDPDSTRMPSSSQHVFHSSSFPSTPSGQPSPLEMDTFSSADIDDSGVVNYCAHSSAGCDAAERDDDLSAYIIPPPPSSSSVVEEQNRVLARFRQAAEDIRRMMAHGSDAASCSRYSDSMSSVSKFCTIPRRHDDGHRNNSSSLASLVTPVRETHGKIGLPHTSVFNGRLQHNNESSSNESESPLVCSQGDPKLNVSCNGPENFSTLNSVCESQAEMGHSSEENSWRPQPPPRLKKLSSSCSESSSSSTECFPLITSSLPCNNNASDCSGVEQGEVQTSSGLDKGSFSRTLSLDSFKGAVQRNKEKTSQNKAGGVTKVPVSLPSNLESEKGSQDSFCGVSQFPRVVPVINGHNHQSENHSQDSEFRHQLNGSSPKILNGSGNSYVNGGCSDGNPENREIAHALQENATKECHDCQGLLNGCVCRKIDRFSSYHQSLPRKVINGGLHVVPIGDINGDGIVENGHCVMDSIGSFQEAQQEIDDMIFHLDATCQTRFRDCEGGLNQDRDLSKLTNDWETLMLESRQFVTASKLFVKSITESSDKMEGNLSTCVTLLDRIFTVSEFVILQMSTPCQITTLATKLKETATAYSRTVQAAHSASSGGIMNPNMASLMHEATSLATSLTMLMRTLRTFHTP